MSLFSEIEKTIRNAVFAASPNAFSDRRIRTSYCWSIAPFWKGRNKNPGSWPARPARVSLFERHGYPGFAPSGIAARSSRRPSPRRPSESDIREALEGAGCEVPRAFAVEVRTAETGPARSPSNTEASRSRSARRPPVQPRRLLPPLRPPAWWWSEASRTGTVCPRQNAHQHRSHGRVDGFRTAVIRRNHIVSRRAPTKPTPPSPAATPRPPTGRRVPHLRRRKRIRDKSIPRRPRP